MNKFYKDIDQKCNERKLQYLAPMPLEHYYEQEKNTTFRGIVIYQFPDMPIPGVFQLYNIKYKQYIGLKFNNIKLKVEYVNRDSKLHTVKAIGFDWNNNVKTLYRSEGLISQRIIIKNNEIYRNYKGDSRPIKRNINKL